MLIEWAESAVKDMEDIYHYQADENGPQFAESVLQKIVSATERLISFPLSGRLGRVLDSRELVVKDLPYLIHYVVEGGTIFIVRVRHTSRAPLQ